VEFPVLKNAEVDFVDTMTGRGFTIKNPNAKSTCGCGSSFSTRVKTFSGSHTSHVRASSALPSRLVQPRLGERVIAAVNLAARFNRPRQRHIQGFGKRVDGQ
jgi:hypothetical protein